MSGVTKRLGWLLGIAVVAVYIFSSNRAVAQITPDGTLTTNVQLNGSIFNITEGTQAGGNLFHSFSQFSVPIGGEAFFNNAVDVQNIISRVTGEAVSNIDGLIRASGTANLFLINPNGIVFGPNASLNVGGSFVATTANAIQFGDNGFFSATNPEAPSPLLTINPSALLFNSSTPAPIQNNSVGLRVPDGRSLLLVGGNISMTGGQLNAFGGRVELAGLSGEGIIGLQVNSNTLSLSFPEGVPRSDVLLSNGAMVDVRANTGGNIVLNVRNLELGAGSALRTGMAEGLGTAESRTGNIEVNAQAAVTLSNGSLISNTLPSGISGKAGEIRITAGALSLTNNAQLDVRTFGQGDAGSITISARDNISLIGSGVFSGVESEAIGTGGNISISTGSLSLSNGAQLFASTRGQGEGDAGNVTITARDNISFDGASVFSNVEAREAVGTGGKINITAGSLSLINGELSVRSRRQGSAGSVTISAKDNITLNGFGVFSSVESEAIGTGGNISISTGSLSLSNGAQLFASTRGRGDAGNVTITARDNISFDGTTVFSDVEAQAIGNGGDINISTGSLSLTNNARLSANTAGNGNAGNITITARDNISLNGASVFNGVFNTVESQMVVRGGNISISTGSLSLSNGAQLFDSTRGRGDAGNVTITARDNISFDGTAVFSDVEAQAIGNGGDINISTGSLSLTNNARLSANTAGNGNAGNITITARDNISFDGASVVSNVEAQAVGRGGNISISTGSLSLSNGAQLFDSTRGRGDAGNVIITARDNISFDGTAVFTTVEPQAVGNGGEINISTGSLSLINNAQLNTESNGQGSAGEIKVRARSIRLDDRSGILARTASGNGGDITLTTQDFLLLRRQSQISTTAGTAQSGGDGGNITINTPSGFIVAVPTENSDITANAFTGRGGRVDITTSGIFGIQPRPRPTPLSDITASSDFGVSGDLTINTSPIDFNLGLVELPASLADTGALIASSCAAFDDTESSKFIVTGRGGLPLSPDEPLTNDVIWSDTRIPNITAQQHPRETALQTSSQNNAVEVVPATGWVFNGKGEVTLISNASNTAGLGNTNAACAQR